MHTQPVKEPLYETMPNLHSVVVQSTAEAEYCVDDIPEDTTDIAWQASYGVDDSIHHVLELALHLARQTCYNSGQSVRQVLYSVNDVSYHTTYLIDHSDA